jgi:hypothetical protein
VCSNAHVAVVAKLDADSHSRFLQYSHRKYGGLIDDWAERIPLEVLHCAPCAHFWYRNQPDPDELARMYAEAARIANDLPPTAHEATDHMRSEMGRLRRLCSGVRPSLLDYGSGHGRWARAGLEAGFMVTAYEPSAERSDEDVSFEVVHQLTQLDGRHFDLIQLEQVLEHVREPLGVLTDIRKYCLPSTVIRITVPNLSRAPEGRAIWQRWPYDGTRFHTLAPYEHLHAFTARSLRRLLVRAGYESLPLHRLVRGWPKIAASSILFNLRLSTGSTSVLARIAADQR